MYQFVTLQLEALKQVYAKHQSDQLLDIIVATQVALLETEDEPATPGDLVQIGIVTRSHFGFHIDTDETVEPPPIGTPVYIVQEKASLAEAFDFVTPQQDRAHA
jgi:hypothetical protein